MCIDLEVAKLIDLQLRVLSIPIITLRLSFLAFFLLHFSADAMNY
jgi:hypothetical protein